MINLFDRFKSGMDAFANYRRLKSRMFAGNPVILNIGRRDLHGDVSLTLLYKNGLILTVGEQGILDFQDKDFSQFLGSPGFSSRDALAHLHKIVLKSLIRYMMHVAVGHAQQERAAEAASKLYLAEAGSASDWVPGLADAAVKPSFPEKELIRS